MKITAKRMPRNTVEGDRARHVDWGKLTVEALNKAAVADDPEDRSKVPGEPKR